MHDYEGVAADGADGRYRATAATGVFSRLLPRARPVGRLCGGGAEYWMSLPDGRVVAPAGPTTGE